MEKVLRTFAELRLNFSGLSTALSDLQNCGVQAGPVVTTELTCSSTPLNKLSTPVDQP